MNNENSNGQPPIIDSDLVFNPETYQAPTQDANPSSEIEPAGPLASTIGAATSSATFGLSDAALSKISPEYAEAQALGREENPELAALGSIAGVVAPAILSGGTSLAARGVSSGIRAAAKAGKIAEKATQEAFKNFVKESSNKKLASEVIAKFAPQAAGAAVEGSLYGAGSLISEAALGNAEFNGENLIAAMGTSAMFGAGALGAGKLIGTVAGKVKDIGIVKTVANKMNNVFDPKDAAVRLSGLSPAQLARNKAINPNYEDDLLSFLQNKVGVKAFDSAETLAFKTSQIKEQAGKKIGEIIEDISTLPGSSANRKDLFTYVARKIDEDVLAPYRGVPGFEPLIKAAQNMQKSYVNLAEKASLRARIGIKEIQSLRQNMDELAYKMRRSQDPSKLQEAAQSARSVFRNLIDEIADQTNPALGRALREANKEYHIASSFDKAIAKKIDKPTFLATKDIVLGSLGVIAGGPLGAAAVATHKFMQSDLKNRLAVMNGIQDSINKVSKAISTSFNNFSKGVKRAYIPASTTVFMKSNLAKKDDGERLQSPKSKQEAYQNLQENVTKLSNDPAYFEQRVLKKFYNLQIAAPETAASALITLKRGIDFLNKVVPKAENPHGPFAKKPFISDYEFGQLARYVQAIEDPISALEDLENGTLTRDQVTAIKEVYPSLYTEIVNKAIEIIEQNPKLPYQKKIQMGILLNLDADETLRPELIMQIQAQFAGAQAQQEAENQQAANQQGSKPTQSGLNRLNPHSRAQTDSERIIKKDN